MYSTDLMQLDARSKLASHLCMLSYYILELASVVLTQRANWLAPCVTSTPVVSMQPQKFHLVASVYEYFT